jgi:hypothetical protein
MSDPSGWLWVITAVVGLGGLGLAIAYGSSMWLRRGSVARQVQDATVRENYRQEEIREKSLDNNTGESVTTPGTSHKDTTKSRGAVTGHNVRYVLAFGLAGTIIAFVVIAIFGGF